MNSNEAKENERILSCIEQIGGGYVWDAEVFAVNLMDIEPTDQEAAALAGLVGVQQIAINAERMHFSTLECLAQISNLQSLVLSSRTISEFELQKLRRLVPEVLLVNE